ncbi:MAG: SAM-dependent methyltransferase [Bacteroidales bacterium]|nr:SAM-dependent methyltransferase [Bacteroidales bacterium]
METINGRLYLIPVTLGGNDYTTVIPEMSVEITRKLRHFIVEDVRTSRRFLRMADREFPIDSTVFMELNEHTRDNEIEGFLEPLLKGHDTGLMSEAGLPGIADPGSKVVSLAHRKGITVIPLAGTSSIIMALISSGFNGQHFTFNGYLPVKPHDRDSKIREIENKANGGCAQIFMETPYRNQKLLEALLSVCRGDTMLCIASDLTLPGESVRSKTIAEWRKEIPDLRNRLTVFVMQ